MSVDPARFADLLADYCLEVEPGQQVLVSASTLAEPLLLEVQRALLERDAWPLLRPELPGAAEAFHAHARDRHVDEVPGAALAEARALDASLRIMAPANTRALSGVDPERLARLARAQREVRELRLARRWALSIWPTGALAQDAGMGLRDYGELLRRALFLDRPDPAAAWAALRRRQARLIERLAGARELRIEAAGTDLTLRVQGRAWINSDGRRNMPSGEVFTGPLEDSARGTIRFGIPSRPAGVDVEGVELTFRDGEVVAARAARGDAYLQRTLATDAGARRLGELGIGTNFGLDRPTGTILLDEKIGGTVHLALGRSYPESGGRNESAVHWDLICDLRDGGRLSADGETVDLDPGEGGPDAPGP